MQECYHQSCDFPGNPDLKPNSFYFLTKTIQAVVLAAADLTGGIEHCDLSHLNLKEDEEDGGPGMEKEPAFSDVLEEVEARETPTTD